MELKTIIAAILCFFTEIIWIKPYTSALSSGIYFNKYFSNALCVSKWTSLKNKTSQIIKAGIAIYGVKKYDNTAPTNIMPAHVKHWFFISREIWALSYNACSSFGNELNPETNLAAFS